MKTSKLREKIVQTLEDIPEFMCGFEHEDDGKCIVHAYREQTVSLILKEVRKEVLKAVPKERDPVVVRAHYFDIGATLQSEENKGFNQAIKEMKDNLKGIL